MRLVYAKNGNEVKVGDEVHTFRGEPVKVTFFREPHKPGSTGKVSVAKSTGFDHTGKKLWTHTREYGVGVINAEWIEREDQRVCPTCDQWADADGGCINQCAKRNANLCDLDRLEQCILHGFRNEALELVSKLKSKAR